AVPVGGCHLEVVLTRVDEQRRPILRRSLNWLPSHVHLLSLRQSGGLRGCLARPPLALNLSVSRSRCGRDGCPDRSRGSRRRSPVRLAREALRPCRSSRRLALAPSRRGGC